ncbi:MAG: hypothetical protein J6R00_07700 [Lentisphaeria bacterium]|nr:hypothetical protein [Lentisphaeria bacterium]
MKIFLLPALIAVMLLSGCSVFRGGNEMVNVRDFGAVGDGKTLDMGAIQKALDTGKIVRFPAGTYLTGTLYMRSGSGIHLEKGAVILGTNDKNHYNKNDFAPQNWWSEAEKASGAHLIVALNVKDISITGEGVIDGNARSIFSCVVTGKDRHYYERPDWRPSQMVWICDSRNIKIDGVTFKDAPYWNCFLYGCENAEISNVSIVADRAVRNTDGLDIDTCKNVYIHDCDIFTGDDSIAIRADGDRTNRKIGGVMSRENVCEDIRVENCRMSSTTCAVRFGVGTGVIRNCKLSNLDIYQSRTGICLCASYGKSRYCEIKDIDISNVKFDGLAAFWYYNDWTGHFDEKAEKLCSNIVVKDFCGKQTNGSIIVGNAGYGMRNLVFKNVNIEQTRDDIREDINSDPNVFRKAWGVPCVMYFRNVDGLDLTGSSFTGAPSAKEVFFDVKNIVR